MAALMDCRAARIRLWPFLDRTLSAAEHRAMQVHLSVCADCGEELGRARALLTRLRSVSASELPPDTRRRLEQVIDGLASDGPALHRTTPTARGRSCTRGW